MYFSHARIDSAIGILYLSNRAFLSHARIDSAIGILYLSNRAYLSLARIDSAIARALPRHSHLLWPLGIHHRGRLRSETTQPSTLPPPSRRPIMQLIYQELSSGRYTDAGVHSNMRASIRREKTICPCWNCGRKKPARYERSATTTIYAPSPIQ